MSDKQVKGYPLDPMRRKEELCLRTYEYEMPFNYANITVWRKDYEGGEFHGVELQTVNTMSPAVKLGRVVPGEWTRMQAAYVAPPEAVRAEFRIDVAGMTPGETLWIADTFAGEVPANWNPYDDLPGRARNLIANPTFAGPGVCPRGWTLNTAGGGTLARETCKANGHAGLRIERTKIALFTEIPVRPMRRVAYSLWAKSTNKLPNTVWLRPRWLNRAGAYINEIGGDRIIVEEKNPMVRVAVIGSACTPAGYVMLEAEPCEEFYRRDDFVRGTAPLRFKQGNLWGMHLRYDQWHTPVQADFGYEEIPAGMIKRNPATGKWRVKTHYREFPFAGMSCAVFEIPRSRKVTIYAGSDRPGWVTDNFPGDDHYSIRVIRTTVAAPGRRKGI
jgi:hypothetical protein